MDPAESSGSFPMKHLKETHSSELVPVKISFGSVKIHDVFSTKFLVNIPIVSSPW